MRKFQSTRGRWPMVLAAVAGSVMLAAPPAVAATGEHTGLTTFQPSSPLQSCTGSNFGDLLSLEYAGDGSLTVGTSVVPVHVEFKTAFAYMGPGGTYPNSSCATAGAGSNVNITSASIVASVGAAGSCTFTAGQYSRGPIVLMSRPTGERAVFTTGTCGGSLAGAGPPVTNDGVSVCVFAPTQTYPQACTTTYAVS